MQITIDSQRYQDHDDCLGAAEVDIREAMDLDGWDLSTRWADGDRSEIELDVPTATCERCGTEGVECEGQLRGHGSVSSAASGLIELSADVVLVSDDGELVCGDCA